MIGSKGRQGLISIVLLSLSACVSDIPMLKDFPYIGANEQVVKPSSKVDRAFADLLRGDFVDAETQVSEALIATPNDPHAILAAAILYQNTGRISESRAMYGRLLAMPPQTARAVVRDWTGLEPRPLNEVARVNLQKLGDDQVFDNWLNRSAPGASAPAQTGPIKTPPSNLPWAATPPANDAAAQANRVRRFTLLAQLRSDGFVSVEEHGNRRAANLGSLLPLSAKRPAAGLDQSFPSDDQIKGRLAGLRQQFRAGLIGRDNFLEQRTQLLDALLPGIPAMVAPPATPPDGLMAAAARVRVLETMKDIGLISSAELLAERTAIEDHLR